MEQQCCRYGDRCPAPDYQPEPLPPFEPRTRKGARPEELGGYRLEAFGNSRYWQVIDPAGELVCVAVYNCPAAVRSASIRSPRPRLGRANSRSRCSS